MIRDAVYEDIWQIYQQTWRGYERSGWVSPLPNVVRRKMLFDSNFLLNNGILRQWVRFDSLYVVWTVDKCTGFHQNRETMDLYSKSAGLGRLFFKRDQQMSMQHLSSLHAMMSKRKTEANNFHRHCHRSCQNETCHRTVIRDYSFEFQFRVVLPLVTLSTEPRLP